MRTQNLYLQSLYILVGVKIFTHKGQDGSPCVCACAHVYDCVRWTALQVTYFFYFFFFFFLSAVSKHT